MSAEGRRQMFEARVRTYFEGCIEANRQKLYGCFPENVVRYFPPGVSGPYVGKKAIADLWIEFVRVNGSRWTIDRMVADDREVAIEWTHFKPRTGEYLRGTEWYEFVEDGLITVIRAYYASPRNTSRKVNEPEGFPYEAKGLPLQPPDEAPGVRE